MSLTDVQRRRTHKAACWQTFLGLKLNECRPQETQTSFRLEGALSSCTLKRSELALYEKEPNASVALSRWMICELHRPSTSWLSFSAPCLRCVLNINVLRTSWTQQTCSLLPPLVHDLWYRNHTQDVVVLQSPCLKKKGNLFFTSFLMLIKQLFLRKKIEL